MEEVDSNLRGSREHNNFLTSASLSWIWVAQFSLVSPSSIRGNHMMIDRDRMSRDHFATWKHLPRLGDTFPGALSLVMSLSLDPSERPMEW